MTRIDKARENYRFITTEKETSKFCMLAHSGAFGPMKPRVIEAPDSDTRPILQKRFSVSSKTSKHIRRDDLDKDVPSPLKQTVVDQAATTMTIF